MWQRASLLLLFYLAGTGPLAAMQDVREVQVRAVLAGDILSLSDGQSLRLAGVLLPQAGRLAAYMQGQAGSYWRYTEAAVRRDRYGIRRGDLLDAEGQSLVLALIGAGYAFAYAGPFGLPPAAAWGLEREAEAAGRGLWGAPGLVIREPVPPDAAGKPVLFRGQVRSVGVRERWTYLNFGADWKRDMTVRLPAAVHQQLAADGLDPAGFGGRWVEARGTLHEDRGPAMLITHGANLRLLPTP